MKSISDPVGQEALYATINYSSVAVDRWEYILSWYCWRFFSWNRLLLLPDWNPSWPMCTGVDLTVFIGIRTLEGDSEPVILWHKCNLKRCWWRSVRHPCQAHFVAPKWSIIIRSHEGFVLAISYIKYSCDNSLLFLQEGQKYKIN